MTPFLSFCLFKQPQTKQFSSQEAENFLESHRNFPRLPRPAAVAPAVTRVTRDGLFRQISRKCHHTKRLCWRGRRRSLLGWFNPDDLSAQGFAQRSALNYRSLYQRSRSCCPQMTFPLTFVALDGIKEPNAVTRPSLSPDEQDATRRRCYRPLMQLLLGALTTCF